MNKGFITIGVCVIMVLAALRVPAQTTAVPSQAWDVLRQLRVNEPLRVERKDGKKFSGRLTSCTDAELLLEHKGRVETLPRAEVRRVWRVAPPNRAKQKIFSSMGVLGGVFAGVLIALPLGFKQCGGSCADEKAAMLGAVIGLPVAGGWAGHVLGGRGKHTLIYVAP